MWLTTPYFLPVVPVIKQDSKGRLKVLGALQGSDASFSCDYEAFPAATVVWTHNNSVIEDSFKHSVRGESFPVSKQPMYTFLLSSQVRLGPIYF